MPSDSEIPPDDGYQEPPVEPRPDEYRFYGDPLDDPRLDGDIVKAWPAVPVTVTAWPPTAPDGPARPHGPPGAGQDQAEGGPPAPGLLDLTVPFATLTCESASPGLLGRIGPVTALQTRRLARLAARDHGVPWRVIVSDEHQQAISVARLPRLRLPAGLRPRGTVSVVGRVTVIVPVSAIRDYSVGEDGDGHRDDAGMTAAEGLPLAAILEAAVRANDHAGSRSAADQAVPGGCAHTGATAVYRPPPRLREHVVARDQTCRHPCCGQPAWRGDLDHTIPWDQGGLTCSCNLGGLCRTHHILKQLPGWTLTQPRPGTFAWTTSAGRTYTTTPDRLPG